MPSEDFIYLGDIARLPYGNKSKEAVTRYSLRCAEFLLANDVRAVVIACNTASALALDTLKRELPVPVVGVVDSGARAAIRSTTGLGILVLATESTVRTEAYPRAIRALGCEVPVRQLSCPLLVSVAEEGLWEHPIADQCVDYYLSQVRSFEYDTAVLGCTHYPWLASSFSKLLPKTVTTVHGGEFAARELQEVLQIVPGAPIGSVRCFATDSVRANLPLLQAHKMVFETVNLD